MNAKYKKTQSRQTSWCNKKICDYLCENPCRCLLGENWCLLDEVTELSAEQWTFPSRFYRWPEPTLCAFYSSYYSPAGGPYDDFCILVWLFSWWSFVHFLHVVFGLLGSTMHIFPSSSALCRQLPALQDSIMEKTKPRRRMATNYNYVIFMALDKVYFVIKLA